MLAEERMATLMTIRFAGKEGDVPMAVEVPAIGDDEETAARLLRMKIKLNDAITRLGERYVLHKSKRITRASGTAFQLEQQK